MNNGQDEKEPEYYKNKIPPSYTTGKLDLDNDENYYQQKIVKYLKNYLKNTTFENSWKSFICCCKTESDFKYRFCRSLNKIYLRSSKKSLILDRFVRMVERYEDKLSNIRKAYYTLNLIIQTGSLIVPALISIQHYGTSDIFWATWIISLLVGLFTNINRLFKIDTKFINYSKVLNLLKSEGWKYLELSDDYNTISNEHKSKIEQIDKNIINKENTTLLDHFDKLYHEILFSTHENMFELFMSNIEKIKKIEVDLNYVENNKNINIPPLIKNNIPLIKNNIPLIKNNNNLPPIKPPNLTLPNKNTSNTIQVDIV